MKRYYISLSKAAVKIERIRKAGFIVELVRLFVVSRTNLRSVFRHYCNLFGISAVS